MERAFDASKYGAISDPPVLEATIPSLVDPSLVAGARGSPGDERHRAVTRRTGCATGRGTRGARRSATWSSGRSSRSRPASARSSRPARCCTPLDLEREFGLSAAHPLHAEPTLDSWFAWRPLLGCARYRMPIDGLYLAGSGRTRAGA